MSTKKSKAPKVQRHFKEELKRLKRNSDRRAKRAADKKSVDLLLKKIKEDVTKSTACVDKIIESLQSVSSTEVAAVHDYSNSEPVAPIGDKKNVSFPFDPIPKIELQVSLDNGNKVILKESLPQFSSNTSFKSQEGMDFRKLSFKLRLKLKWLVFVNWFKQTGIFKYYNKI